MNLGILRQKKKKSYKGHFFELGKSEQEQKHFFML